MGTSLSSKQNNHSKSSVLASCSCFTYGFVENSVITGGRFYLIDESIHNWFYFLQDELLWAAMWLHEATGQESYLQYVAENAQQLGGTGWAMDQFGWDNKYAGVQLKAAKVGFVFPHYNTKRCKSVTTRYTDAVLFIH